MASITKIKILDAKSNLSRELGRYVNFKVRVVTTNIHENDEIILLIGFKNANGNGCINYTRYHSVVLKDVETNGSIDGEIDISEVGVDHIACEESIRFYIADNQNTKLYDSIDLYLPWEQTPSSSYVLTEVPSILTQDVYYNNSHRGKANCCVVCAIASAKELHEMRRKSADTRMSIGWFYGMLGENKGYEEDDEIYFYDAFEQLQSNGMMAYSDIVAPSHMKNQYPDSYFMEDSGEYTGARTLYKANNNPAMALRHKIASFRKIGGYTINQNRTNVLPYNWSDIFSAIMRSSGNSSSAVVMGYGIEDSFDNASGNGYVQDSNGGYVGGHLFLVLGWVTVNGRKYWKCQNSWGVHWGDDGYCYIPFTNTGLAGNDKYAAGVSEFFELIDDPSVPILPSVYIWDWNKSNGSATEERTKNMYKVLMGEIPIGDNFSASVWNDLVDKVLEVVKSRGKSWSTKDNFNPDVTYLNPDQCKVAVGEIFSAQKYNSVRFQIGSIKSTGIDNRKKGDPIKGYHIIHLVEIMNDIINGKL